MIRAKVRGEMHEHDVVRVMVGRKGPYLFLKREHSVDRMSSCGHANVCVHNEPIVPGGVAADGRQGPRLAEAELNHRQARAGARVFFNTCARRKRFV